MNTLALNSISENNSSKKMAGGDQHSATSPRIFKDKDGNILYRVYSALDALKPQPPMDWYVEEFLSKGSVSLLVGESGCKKTWAMLAMAVCIADGRDWVGHKTKKSQVLFIDEESGKTRLLHRVNRVMAGYGINYDIPFFSVSDGHVNLMASDGEEKLRTMISEQKADVVIIDALAEIMPGGDENSVKDVLPVFLTLRRIAEVMHCAILVIHHTNKSGGYRGSSAMKAAVDLLCIVQAKANTEILTFDSEKARDVEPFRFCTKAHFVGDHFYLESRELGGETLNFGAAKRHALLYLLRNGQSKANSIKANPVGCEPETVRTSLSGLVNEGLVQRVNTPGKGVVFALTEAGGKIASHLLPSG
jgi:hypothetical protein